VVVDGLHVGGQDLARGGDVDRGAMCVGAEVLAHVSAVGAVSDGSVGGVGGGAGWE
jgi:hypothetical protein